MGRPEAYAPVSATVERIETHVSVVFLAGAFAYKVKRAVKYYVSRLLHAGKAAFGLPERASRQPANRAQLYLDVFPVTRGEGESFGLAARMKRWNGCCACADSSNPSSSTAWPRRGGLPWIRCGRSPKVDRRLPRLGRSRAVGRISPSCRSPVSCPTMPALRRPCRCQSRSKRRWALASKSRKASAIVTPARGARTRRLRAPLPRRSPFAQHRGNRWRAGLIRCHRVR